MITQLVAYISQHNRTQLYALDVYETMTLSDGYQIKTYHSGMICETPIEYLKECERLGIAKNNLHLQ